jgi:hypothetical protein
VALSCGDGHSGGVTLSCSTYSMRSSRGNGGGGNGGNDGGGRNGGAAEATSLSWTFGARDSEEHPRAQYHRRMDVGGPPAPRDA